MNYEQAFKEIVVENCPHRNHYDDGKTLYCQKKYEKRCKKQMVWIDFNCPKDCPKLPQEIDCTPNKCKYITDLIIAFKYKINNL